MINSKLDALMKAKGIASVLDLSYMTRINHNTLYQMRNGRLQRIDLSVLNRLCKALGCTVGDLLEYVPDEKGEIV